MKSSRLCHAEPSLAQESRRVPRYTPGIPSNKLGPARQKRMRVHGRHCVSSNREAFCDQQTAQTIGRMDLRQPLSSRTTLQDSTSNNKRCRKKSGRSASNRRLIPVYFNVTSQIKSTTCLRCPAAQSSASPELPTAYRDVAGSRCLPSRSVRGRRSTMP